MVFGEVAIPSSSRGIIRTAACRGVRPGAPHRTKAHDEPPENSYRDQVGFIPRNRAPIDRSCSSRPGRDDLQRMAAKRRRAWLSTHKRPACGDWKFAAEESPSRAIGVSSVERRRVEATCRSYANRLGLAQKEARAPQDLPAFTALMGSWRGTCDDFLVLKVGAKRAFCPAEAQQVARTLDSSATEPRRTESVSSDGLL
jgi:hypothetical protein